MTPLPRTNQKEKKKKKNLSLLQQQTCRRQNKYINNYVEENRQRGPMMYIIKYNYNDNNNNMYNIMRARVEVLERFLCDDIMTCKYNFYRMISRRSIAVGPRQRAQLR